jgi:hypothetical protein
MNPLLVIRDVVFKSGRVGPRLHKLVSYGNRVSGRIEMLLVDESNTNRTHRLELSPEQARHLVGSLLELLNNIDETPDAAGVLRIGPGDFEMTNLTKDRVLAVLREYDEIGEAEFLAKHNFRPGRYMLVRNGKRYHSKAVFGVAMGKGAGEFSGGAATVQRAAQKLGLKVEVAS